MKPDCGIRGCIHLPGFVIVCDGGYDQELALASVGPGWASLVREAFDIVKGKASIEQVKEKFGGLRIYIGRLGPDDFDSVHAAISRIEAQSYKTCEMCGAPGKSGGTGWIKTLCDPCRAKREFSKVGA